MNKQGRGRIIIIMVAILLIFLAIFYFAANGRREEHMEKLTATESAILRDLSINYPQTPKAVVRYYAELSQCMYDPSNSDEEIEAIARQSRLLFDDELKGQQSDSEYLSSLKTTIAGFLKDNRRIVSFTVSNSSEVMYRTMEIGDIASLYCTYTMQKGSVSYSDPEHFLLRKDRQGRWKILGWQSASLDNEGGSAETDVDTAAPAESGAAAGQGGTTDSGQAGEAPAVEIEIPTVEIPTVEINVPGVNN